MKLVSLFALFLAVSQVMYAKQIKVENKFNGPVTVKIAHFYTITGIERRPTISTFVLQAGQSETLSPKPYQYTSNLYTPNEAWINDLKQSPYLEDELITRQKEVYEKYSFGPNSNNRFSIQVIANGKNNYFVNVNDNSLGQLIQNMAERPDDNPSDGIRVIGGGTGVLLSVNAGVESKVYKAE